MESDFPVMNERHELLLAQVLALTEFATTGDRQGWEHSLRGDAADRRSEILGWAIHIDLHSLPDLFPYWVFGRNSRRLSKVNRQSRLITPRRSLFNDRKSVDREILRQVLAH
jgi:hypothetical protein